MCNTGICCAVGMGSAHVGNTGNNSFNLQCNNVAPYRVFIKPRRSENSPATTQNFRAKFHPFLERASLFHFTLSYSPATTILNENPGHKLNENVAHITMSWPDNEN